MLIAKTLVGWASLPVQLTINSEPHPSPLRCFGEGEINRNPLLNKERERFTAGKARVRFHKVDNQSSAAWGEVNRTILRCEYSGCLIKSGYSLFRLR